MHSITLWKPAQRIGSLETISTRLKLYLVGCTPKEIMLDIHSLIIWAQNLDFRVPSYIFRSVGPVLKHSLTQTHIEVAKV